MKTGDLFFDINSLPDDLKKQVADFIEILKQKHGIGTDKEQKKPTNKKNAGTRLYGSMKGAFKLSKDFDAPLEDLKDYM